VAGDFPGAQQIVLGFCPAAEGPVERKDKTVNPFSCRMCCGGQRSAVYAAAQQ
jgi:hypothetical protein